MSFTSRLEFVPKIFDNGVLPCYETTQKINLDPEHPLPAHFLNNEGPVMEMVEDNSGVKIFWRRGMMDTCVQAVEWTVNGNTTRKNKSEDITANEDSIFISATCKSQEVMLTYIFSDDSNFLIGDSTRKLEVQAFKKNNECLDSTEVEVVAVGPEESKSNDTGSWWPWAVGAVLILIVIIVIVVIFMRKRKGTRRMTQQDIDENHTYGLYQTDSQENLPTESEVIDENEYYGT